MPRGASRSGPLGRIRDDSVLDHLFPALLVIDDTFCVRVAHLMLRREEGW